MSNIYVYLYKLLSKYLHIIIIHSRAMLKIQYSPLNFFIYMGLPHFLIENYFGESFSREPNLFVEFLPYIDIAK
jgi:hypothetical protein